MEGGLGGLRSDFLCCVLLLEKPKELLALLFVFGVDVDQFRIGIMPVHGITRADHMKLSEGEQGENAVD